MSTLGVFGIKHWIRHDRVDRTEFLVVQKPLHRVMAFTRRSIDDIINNPIAKREVAAYYKLHKWVDREMEISTLEHQWNSI
jgi:hypothetical protein